VAIVAIPCSELFRHLVFLCYCFFVKLVLLRKFSFSLYLLRAVIAQSVYRWAMGWTIGVRGFNSRRGLGIFLSTTVSRMALGPTQPPIQWVPGELSLEVRWQRREADHSSHLVPRSKKEWSYTSTLQIRLHAVVLS
jgi:hypothetical protein